MLLNLMAALSLASAGAVAGIASNPQSVDDVELDKSSLIERKNANIAFVNGVIVPYFEFLQQDYDVVFDDLMPYHANSVAYNVWPDYFADGFGYSMGYDSEDSIYTFSICTKATQYAMYLSTAEVYVNGSLFSLDGYYAGSPQNGYVVFAYKRNSSLGGFEWLDYNRVVFLYSNTSYAEYEASHQIVSGIASGLTSVQHYATSLVSGFDALALDNGALTNSMAFAFTLLGIGTAVGICKLTFNWITGRHGM